MSSSLDDDCAGILNTYWKDCNAIVMVFWFEVRWLQFVEHRKTAVEVVEVFKYQTTRCDKDGD